MAAMPYLSEPVTIGDYMLKSKLGGSSVSIVWKAESKSSGELVGVKQVFLSKLNKHLANCLDCELSFLSSVNHPHIIRLLHVLQNIEEKGIFSKAVAIRSSASEDRAEKQTFTPGPGYRQFSGRNEFPSNILHGTLAYALWIGFMQFNVSVLFSLIFLPFSKILLVVGILAGFFVLPIDENSKFGLRLASYVCRHMASYFPTTLHVEDINDFHPDRACVFGYEPHSVLPIGVVPLAERTGFMPLPKLKCLTSSPVSP
ncbi:diacylglycerol O-acyltransferase 2D-like [Hibiscus syriacus]|uniref:diacylglycerol O-acyltransferase 2D-like n=1 Tax=Hibiscus syriacus TaxID=106335 RepID=UPI001920AA44|nr:diacylglycerol O-acyltransferase 2D-like [Hibiscus syriacus]